MNNYPVGEFYTQDGQPDIDQIEEWVESYFSIVMNMINGFLSSVDIKEAAARIKDIPFEQLVREQLADESDEVVAIAAAKMKELAEMQVAYLQSYAESR